MVFPNFQNRVHAKLQGLFAHITEKYLMFFVQFFVYVCHKAPLILVYINE